MGEFRVKALNYVVIVKPKKLENLTESGLDFSSEADKNEKFRKGEIMSFGNLCPKKPIWKWLPFWKKDTIKIGQEVLYDMYKASDLTIDGEKYQSFYYADLIAILE